MCRLLPVLLQLCVAGSASHGPAALAQSPPSSGLTEYRSAGGLLAVTLLAEAGKVRIGELEVDGLTYNGLYAGPVLRVRPGDMLRIRLINHLSQPTNLHFHGIFTSPLGFSDNIHLSVAPGDTFTYQVRIPATQPPGLFWYHSHIHGISERQVMGGLSGALVVEPPADPGVAERLFVLKDMTFDDDTGDATIDDELHGLVQSINGDLEATNTMRPGETQLWRFSNQSANRPFHIALTGHRFRIVAEDGEATIGERVVDVLDIMPSSRVEVLVEGGAPGRYDLISKGAMTGAGAARRLERVLGHLVIKGEASAAAAFLPITPPPSDLREASIDARRVVVFTQTTTTKPGDQIFYINRIVFDAARIDLRVPLGNVEEWTVRNDTDDLHVFHIHQLGFQVIEINGAAVAFTGRVDTIRVPERGEVKLRMAFTDPIIVGQFVFHCHVLRHEDRGMMAQIEIYDPRPDDLREQVRRLYFHLWWWAHGVPWSLCGLGSV
jgi:suppressor of ftsI